MTKTSLGNKHLILPDPQCRPGVPDEHLEWAGRYIVDKKPDVVVHLGDHWDMPSLSKWDKGTLKIQGRRYAADVEAGNAAMRKLLAPMKAYNASCRRHKKKLYKPRMVFLLGNHEDRITRAINEDPERLQGTIGFHDLYLDDWEVYDFLQPVQIDGVHYAHYFYNPLSGRPWSGMASTMLKNIGFSFTQGHRQGKQSSERHLADGSVHRGLIVGSFYQHDEEYKGPQANHHWRGIIVKHQVKDGIYDMLEVSLDYLRQRYENGC